MRELPAIHEAMEAVGLANLVTWNGTELLATPLPLILVRDEGEFGTLYGHLAKANPQGSAPVVGEALALFSGVDAYITPSWYATKQETGKVVPTWNYETIPAKGLSSLHITPPETAEIADKASEISLATPNFHRTWQGLKYSYLSAGPELRLHNLADAYTLRLMALTPSIRNFRVDVPQDGNAVSVTFSTEGPDGARTVVGPGETLQWHLRIQVAPNNSYSPTSN